MAAVLAFSGIGALPAHATAADRFEIRVADGEWSMTQFSIAPGSYEVWLNSSMQNFSSPGDAGWRVVQRATLQSGLSLGISNFASQESGVFVRAGDGTFLQQEAAMSLGETGPRNFRLGAQTMSTTIGEGTFYLLVWANVHTGSFTVKIESPAGTISPLAESRGETTAIFLMDDFEGIASATAAAPVPDGHTPPNEGVAGHVLLSNAATFHHHPLMHLGMGPKALGRVAITTPDGVEHASGISNSIAVFLSGIDGPGEYRADIQAALVGPGGVGSYWATVDFWFPDEAE